MKIKATLIGLAPSVLSSSATYTADEAHNPNSGERCAEIADVDFGNVQDAPTQILEATLPSHSAPGYHVNQAELVGKRVAGDHDALVIMEKQNKAPVDSNDVEF